MKEKQKLDQLKEEYNNIEIPCELDFIVKNSIHKSNLAKKKFSIFKISSIAAMLIFGIFIGGINISPAFAQTLSKLPVLNSLVDIFTFKIFEVKKDEFEINIKVPNISGLEDKDLESSLNAKFIEEGQKLYDDFIKEIENIKHFALESNYEIKADNETVLSIVITQLEIMASSNTAYKSYVIDKTNKAIVSLPSLFKNEEYIEIISDNIKTQMREQMKSDENIIYFIDQVDIPADDFKSIKSDQNFYINQDNKLVILFDEYEIAPGYMGNPEFIIPTEIINDLLLDRNLIK